MDLLSAKNTAVFQSWHQPEQRGTMRNSGLQKLFRKERVSQNTRTRFLPWGNESKGFSLVIPQAAEHNRESQHSRECNSPWRIHYNFSWLDLGASNGFLPKSRANNTAELLEKGGQAEQEAKFRGKGSASLMFNVGCSSSPVSVPVHGLNPRAEVPVTLRVAATWEWLLQEQQEWHILTATGQKAALMEIEGNLSPSCESWKSGVLPVLGERTIWGGKTPNPLESDLVRVSSGIQSEGLRDNITEQPRFELPPRKNLPPPHSPEQNV